MGIFAYRDSLDWRVVRIIRGTPFQGFKAAPKPAVHAGTRQFPYGPSLLTRMAAPLEINGHGHGRNSDAPCRIHG